MVFENIFLTKGKCHSLQSWGQFYMILTVRSSRQLITIKWGVNGYLHKIIKLRSLYSSLVVTNWLIGIIMGFLDFLFQYVPTIDLFQLSQVQFEFRIFTFKHLSVYKLLILQWKYPQSSQAIYENSIYSNNFRRRIDEVLIRYQVLYW